MRTPRVLAAAALMLSCAFAYAEPVPFRAVYKATYNGVPISATGIRELRKIEEGYVIENLAKSFLASVREESRFRLGENDGIVPLEYQYHRRGIGRNETDVLRFDWEDMQVKRIADEDGEKWQREMQPGIQDKLSYQVEMRDALSAARADGEDWPEMTYQVAEDDGRIREYRFRIVAEETVTVPAGTFETIKAERVRDDSQRTTHFWLSPAHDFLLVRLEQQESDGGGFKLLLKEFRFGDEQR